LQRGETAKEVLQKNDMGFLKVRSGVKNRVSAVRERLWEGGLRITVLLGGGSERGE